MRNEAEYKGSSARNNKYSRKHSTHPPDCRGLSRPVDWILARKRTESRKIFFSNAFSGRKFERPHFTLELGGIERISGVNANKFLKTNKMAYPRHTMCISAVLLTTT